MFVPWAAALPRAPRPWRGVAAACALLITSLVLSACEAGSEYPQTTFRPVSEFGDKLNAVFYNTFWWTMAILVIVVALILYAVFRFRERPGAPQPKQIHGNTMLEIGWTIVPAVIVVFISIPTVRTIFETQRRPPEDALVIDVIGHQWWWEFRYPEYEITTANQLFIPTGRPISLVMRSADVIHSFWIPKIGGKRDVNPLPRRREDAAPAHPNYLTFTVREPGHYDGQCAEYCGEAHGIMRMSAMAVEPTQVDAWIQRMRGASPSQMAVQATLPVVPVTGDTAAARTAADVPEVGPPAAAQTVAQVPRIGQMPAPTGAGNPFRATVPDSLLQMEGKRIFEAAACVACHAIAGTPAIGTIGPNLTLFGARPLLAAGAAENTQADVVRWIRDPQSIKPGALMPGTVRGGGGMAPTGLSEAEVRAVAAYLSSLK
jgi:cytochrome c oxidase subunit 2